MGLWTSLTGRSRPVRANLDSLFAVPTAAVALETTLGYRPTGDGSVCFRAAAGAAFEQTQTEVVELLRVTGDAPRVDVTQDGFGYSWIEIDREPGADVGGLVTSLHAVNTALESQGFGSGLLCTVVGFEGPGGRRLGLVYLYKQGTFYPFAPTGERQRDNLLEVQALQVLDGELPLERDQSRWLAVWGSPGL